MSKKYPYYMRSEGSCAKVNSATDCWIVTLPPEEPVACREHKVFGSEKAQEDYLSVYTDSDAAEFRSFLFTFYQKVAEEREKMNGHG